jgi:hypothetical protein
MNSPSNLNQPGVNAMPLIGWGGVRGIYLRYEGVSDAALVTASMVTAEELPGVRYKCGRHGQDFKLHRRKDGLLNGSFDAEFLLARNKSFKRFFGGLLADTRLSLVRDEPSL